MDPRITQAFEILKVKGSDYTFDVEGLIKEIGTSRSQLHRKLKELTDLSASEFIRDYRLSIAYNMLKNGRRNIAQVAYDSGFNTPSYFSQCFKNKYNIRPRDARRKTDSRSKIGRYLLLPFSYIFKYIS